DQTYVLNTDTSYVPVRIYEPQRPIATLVYAHGGGWVTGDLEYSDAFCRQIAHDAKLRVLSVDYRLAPEFTFPSARIDVIAVFEWAKSKFNNSPMHLGGDSAGANLAAVIAREFKHSIASTLLIYPVLDSDMSTDSYKEMFGGFPVGLDEMRWFFEHYAPRCMWKDPRISLLQGDVDGYPQTLILTAGHDPLRDEGFDFVRRLNEAQIRVMHRHEPRLCHGFLRYTAISNEAMRAQNDIVQSFASFLRRITRE